jgi:hypothetical protein
MVAVDRTNIRLSIKSLYSVSVGLIGSYSWIHVT